MHLGIDFSLNSPTFCFELNNNYHWINFSFESNYTKKNLKEIEDLNNLDCVDIIYFPEKYKSIKNEKEIKETEKLFLKNDFIFYNIIKYINNYNIEDVKIVLEGFSYSSNSIKLYQFAGSNYYLRRSFIEAGYNNIDIIAPSTIKKFAGNGRANKDMMLEFFKEKFKDKQNNFLNFVLKIYKLYKPIDDLIDSYWMAKYAKDI